MDELPFHLKTLAPLQGALNILRYFGDIESETADIDEIADHLDLSDRSASKAIRRLVTKGYLVMDGDQIYRLTDQGEDAVMTLREYDEAQGHGNAIGQKSPTPPKHADVQNITRRMVVALPETLTAEQTSNIVVGFHEKSMPAPAEIAVRVSIINGEPEKPEDLLFSLDSAANQQVLQVRPGLYDKIRLRAQVVQLGPNPGDFSRIGGLYIDVPVAANAPEQTQFKAYGTNVTVAL